MYNHVHSVQTREREREEKKKKTPHAINKSKFTTASVACTYTCTCNPLEISTLCDWPAHHYMYSESNHVVCIYILQSVQGTIPTSCLASIADHT